MPNGDNEHELTCTIRNSQQKLIFKPTAIFSRVPCISDVIKGGPASFNYRTFTLIAVAMKRNR